MAYHADALEPEGKEILTWEGFGEATQGLARSVVDSGFLPDIIIAVARGGLLPAGALSYESIAGRRLLVVDDVADSGRTLALVLELLRGFGAEARSAVIYAKPRSVVAPDYMWKATDEWIVFPWSAAPPLTVGS